MVYSLLLPCFNRQIGTDFILRQVQYQAIGWKIRYVAAGFANCKGKLGDSIGLVQDIYGQANGSLLEHWYSRRERVGNAFVNFSVTQKDSGFSSSETFIIWEHRAHITTVFAPSGTPLFQFGLQTISSASITLMRKFHERERG